MSGESGDGNKIALITGITGQVSSSISKCNIFIALHFLGWFLSGRVSTSQELYSSRYCEKIQFLQHFQDRTFIC